MPRGAGQLGKKRGRYAPRTPEYERWPVPDEEHQANQARVAEARAAAAAQTKLSEPFW